MATAETIVRLAKGDKGLTLSAPKVSKGGKVKYEARTEDGVLVIVYLPADQARKSLDGIGIRVTGPKAQIEQPKADETAGAEGLV